MHNSQASCSRFTFRGVPFTAISSEVTVDAWTIDSILAGSRLRTRRHYAAVTTGVLLGAGFELVPTFAAPHYSVLLHPYTYEKIEELVHLFGEIHVNPHFVRRKP